MTYSKGTNPFLHLYCHFLLIEPTGKIAPKLPGRKYEGGEIYVYPQNETAVLTCDVVGFPVPFFR